jgi:hypothetical protein
VPDVHDVEGQLVELADRNAAVGVDAVPKFRPEMVT